MNENNNNFDDLFAPDAEGYAADYGMDSQPFDKDAWAERKQKERADMYALVDEGTEAIASDPEHFKSYLNVQARFDRYSVTNAILIEKQMPDAAKLADFDTWKASKVNIKKGENAISIFEPGNEYTREDGSTGVSVNIKKVFDISQTTAKPAPAKHNNDMRTVIKALISASPCAVVMDSEKTEQKAAVYSPEANVIYIRQGMSGENIFRALSQEAAVAKFAAKGLDRSSCAFYTYCTAYILCERNGFDTTGYNFDRVPDVIFKGMEPKAVREQLTSIRDMANSISQDMSRALEAIERSSKNRDEAAR